MSVSSSPLLSPRVAEATEEIAREAEAEGLVTERRGPLAGAEVRAVAEEVEVGTEREDVVLAGAEVRAEAHHLAPLDPQVSSTLRTSHPSKTSN